MGFLAPQGRTLAPMEVKFGRFAKFHLPISLPTLPIAPLQLLPLLRSDPPEIILDLFRYSFITARITCEAGNRTVLKLLRRRFWGFSPRMGEPLHRWGEIWQICQISPPHLSPYPSNIPLLPLPSLPLPFPPSPLHSLRRLCN